MSDQIKAGDLVMVVRGHLCCGVATGSEGVPFTVSGIVHAEGICARCGEFCAGEAAMGLPRRIIRLGRLIKLPGLSEPDHVEHKEEITA